MPKRYGPMARRASLSNPNMDIREGDQHQQQIQNLQDQHAQRERIMQTMIARVQNQAKERDAKVGDMQEKMAKMVKVHTDQLESQRKAVREERERVRAVR